MISIEGFDYLELEEILSANRMAIDLTNNQALAEVTLQDGDRIYVPKDDRSIQCGQTILVMPISRPKCQ